jgi:hypothetical protein
LAAVIVLVVDHESGALHQRPDPPHAVVAVIVVLLEAVANEEALGRAVVHINPKHARRARSVVGRPFFAERVPPVFGHAVKAFLQDERCRVRL